ncbi:hypothetical protein F4780DRAFT_776437 [Xylariomycetidae sp. FL0641]|nr:hypothetical protein F4780DRAFT_776437 [Xylariomycetidae sp. FL0641]
MGYQIKDGATVNVPRSFTQEIPPATLLSGPTFEDASVIYAVIQGKIALEAHLNSGGVPNTKASKTPSDNSTLTGAKAYKADVDLTNTRVGVVSENQPAIQGILAAEEAAHRLGFWCNVALQDPKAAAIELNAVSRNTYVDDPAHAAFRARVASLDVPVRLHPRAPPPGQQRLCAGCDFMAESLPLQYYWTGNVCVTAAGLLDEGALLEALGATGEDRVLFGVDYPFQGDREAAH